jgi:hypothetical protein
MTGSTATRARVRRLLERKGATVTLSRTGGRVYDPATDTWSGGTAESATAPAMETKGDADRFAALGLRLTNPVTLVVAASAIEFAPAPGMLMAWAGTTYTVRDVEPRSLDGEPLTYRVTGGL